MNNHSNDDINSSTFEEVPAGKIISGATCEEGSEVATGVYLGAERFGDFNSLVHIIESSDGTRARIFGSTDLNNRFDKVPVGKVVRVIFDKRIPIAKGSGVFFKWMVLVAKA